MTAVVDIRIPEKAEATLKKRGFSVCKLPSHPRLPRPVASHPDMLVFFAQDAVFCAKSYYDIAKSALDEISRTAQRQLVVRKDSLGSTYPHDIMLNAAPVGKFLFCLPSHTENEIKERYRVIPVKQGYAKCSTIPIGPNALITADLSIARAATNRKIDVLTVRQGYVGLDGYDTGFLGGAASYAPYSDRREIFFCGALSSHPDHETISRFCKERGYETISLSDEPLTDVGTIFLIDGE